MRHSNTGRGGKCLHRSGGVCCIVAEHVAAGWPDGDLRRGWGRNVLVGSEIALAMVLVIGAGLIIKAAAEELGGDFGFDPGHVLTARVSLTNARYHDPARRIDFLGDAIEKLRGLPGVEAAAVANAVPFNAGQQTFSIRRSLLTAIPSASVATATEAKPGFLRSMRAP